MTWSLFPLISLFFPLITSSTPPCDIIQPFINITANSMNPFRGFVDYVTPESSHLPKSMEYTYIALKDIMINDNIFNWTVLDGYLEQVSSRGNHLIFRVYVDYPNCCPDGTYTTGIPDFLFHGQGSVQILANGTSDFRYGLPDYSNPRLITAMEQAITVLGARYDQDNRIAYIQLGLLGFWGEWHTAAIDDSVAYLFPNRTIQERILRAYNNSFVNTRLLVSADELKQWDRGTSTIPTNLFHIGYHDDDFSHMTYNITNPNQDDQFYTNLKSHQLTNYWMIQPIGGEVQPAFQSQVFDPSLSPATDGSDTWEIFEPAASITHVSWLLDYFAFRKDTNIPRVEHTRQAADSIGYQFAIQQVTINPPAECTGTGTKCVNMSVTIVNNGNAPFYYPLSLVASIRGMDDETFVGYETFAGSPSSMGNGSIVILSHVVSFSSQLSQVTVILALRTPRALPNRPIVWANQGITSTGGLPVLIQATCAAQGAGTSSPTASTPTTTAPTPTTTSGTGGPSSTGSSTGVIVPNHGYGLSHDMWCHVSVLVWMSLLVLLV